MASKTKKKAAEECGLTDKQLKKIKDDLKKARSWIGRLEKLGAQIPKALTRSLKTLSLAVETGINMHEALTEASAEMKAFYEQGEKICSTINGVGTDAEWAKCEMMFKRDWQLKSVKKVFDIKSDGSVVSKMIRKTLQSITPKVICKQWDACAVQCKKAQKTK